MTVIHTFLSAVVILWLLSSDIINGDISANFNGMIVMENATVYSRFEVTDNFSAMVTEVLRLAAQPPSPLMAMAYNLPPHLVIMLNMWCTGTPNEVETQIDKINKTYLKWSAGDNANINGALNHLTVTSINQQPTLIKYTNYCMSWNDLLPPGSAETCWRNLSLTFYTAITSQPDPRASLQSALCSFLPTDCELIGYGELARVQIPFNGTIVTVNAMPFTVLSADREATLAMLVTYAQLTSVLTEQNIIYILAGGVQVFFSGAPQKLSVPGNFEQCVAQMWYLIFLIILAPVFLIISHRLFHRGLASGRRSIKKSETDIRAGVYLNAASWANFGGNPYLYASQQGYGGSYSDVSGRLPADGGFVPSQNGVQQFSGQSIQTTLQG
ncbi:hypothetical protein LSCM1_04954 [Leishmania martiniquensis]|uniref:Uncharacterized protein n=1 Tax=Leishmania martiniquensis TaxID=1580590 RepID=A0A836GM45_9TRYP|nr:hypothetical protein LSCM1_04954 [Leishmania martiniquensis]